MPDNQGQEWEEEKSLQPFGDQAGDLSLPSGPHLPQDTDELQRLSANNHPVAKKAIWDAISDIEEIEKLHRSGKFISIDLEGVADRARDLARKDIKERYNDDPPDERNRKRLLAIYESAYLTRFKEGLSSDLEGIRYLNSPQEVRLRDLAIQDRRNSPSRRDYHIRDLAVIRVLQELHTPLDIATDCLSEIHTLADRYQEYYSNPREGVTWPGFF